MICNPLITLVHCFLLSVILFIYFIYFMFLSDEGPTLEALDLLSIIYIYNKLQFIVNFVDSVLID